MKSKNKKWILSLKVLRTEHGEVSFDMWFFILDDVIKGS